MQRLNKNQLVTYTALSIITQDNNQQIQQIRKVHDPAYQRWNPHINICFPFVNPDKFELTHNILQKAFQGFKKFQIIFRKMDSFTHGTVFLVPQTEKNQQLKEIYQKVCQALPQCQSKKQFHPHMTVGKFDKHNVNKFCDQLSKNWKQWKIKVKGLHMIRRGKDTPFKTQKIVHFQN